jgi:hypothetical protein
LTAISYPWSPSTSTSAFAEIDGEAALRADLGEPAEYRSTRGVGEGGEDAVEIMLLLRIVHHAVNYSRWWPSLSRTTPQGVPAVIAKLP